MQGRELGCKTLGCATAILIVLLCFYGMMTTTEKIARVAKAKQATKSKQTARQSLQAIAISVASYEADAGHLPPTTSPDDFKNALSPRFLSDTSVLFESGSDKPFLPNPAVSEKKRSAFKEPGNVPLLTTAPNATGLRTVLLLSGEVRELDSDAYDSLIAPKKPRPAPAGTSVPGASPAPAPR
ncbi:MAG: hypothetical protein H8F28_28110 [Fibrella sp.]|nr:hypothetical protein [Armatimonadota bacterium]